MSNDKMREEFEAWVKTQEWHFGPACESLIRCDEQPDDYLCAAVHGAWLAWQASREALEQSAISPEVQAMLSQFEADEADEIRRAESYVRETGRASISALQRNFKLCYGNACRLMDKLVALKVVSPIDPEGRRTVLPQQVKP